MNLDGFPFEGGQVTARMLKRRGMVYSEGAIQSALEAGCKTMPDLLAFIERQQAESKVSAGKAGYAAYRAVYG